MLREMFRRRGVEMKMLLMRRRRGPILLWGVPANALRAEDGSPLLTETGEYILAE